MTAWFSRKKDDMFGPTALSRFLIDETEMLMLSIDVKFPIWGS